MAGSTFGNMFRVTTWGESHGIAIGAVIDGCPAGVQLEEEDIQKYLNRRKPGQSKYATQRDESDQCRILSGVMNGVTTGTPISVIVENMGQRSSDYTDIASYYRPGHADYTYDSKYGFRDYRGGGRSSGRETIGRVIGGAVAAKILKDFGITVKAFTQSVAHISIDYDNFDMDNCNKNSFYMPDNIAASKAEEYIWSLMGQKDSAGGIISCMVNGVRAGLGEPVFDKMDAEISKAVMSIGAVKGIEFGSGFLAATMTGSQNNDEFGIKEKNGKQIVYKKSNNAGGVLGGITDGSSIIFSVAVKPTASIAQPQNTVNQDYEEIEIEIKGRHDPIIVPRAVVVVETMTAITVLDMLLRNMSSNIQGIKKYYD